MFRGNYIVVPTYQRAYAWETPSKNHDRKTQTDVFIADLEAHQTSGTNTPYYFGHFLFEEKGDDKYFVIDGQQRLTTIVIFLSALFSRLKSLRKLTNKETMVYEDIIERNGEAGFSTVDYDNAVFQDYIINQSKTNRVKIDTESAHRLIDAFEHFKRYFNDKDEPYLASLLDIVSNASCTTHLVKHEAEAIQMFIFQNDRGKKPSNLEVIKAQFMYVAHLKGGAKTNSIIADIKHRFETIYKSIASIEYKLHEDEVLLYTLRVHFNSISADDPIGRINKELASNTPIDFIKDFTFALSESFEYLSVFFGKDEQANYDIHSLISLGRIGFVCPFIIKAYKFGLNTQDIGRLSKALESLLLRHRLIGTRAEMASRIGGVYASFTEQTSNIQSIIDLINYLKTAGNQGDWWWSYWNNGELEKNIQGRIQAKTAVYLLWKYENHLQSIGKNGYKPTRFTDIDSPELEHIAPQTEPETKKHGYDKYDDKFINEYIDCLGNYLLISKSHNCSVGNATFAEKHRTYNHLAQQREVQQLVPETGTWGKTAIKQRKDNIINFILSSF